jgi:hypothetical protein
MDPTLKENRKYFLIHSLASKINLKLSVLKENQCEKRNLNKRNKNSNGKPA